MLSYAFFRHYVRSDAFHHLTVLYFSPKRNVIPTVTPTG
jgi:hypothetical protein